jgi:hypothetical protein
MGAVAFDDFFTKATVPFFCFHGQLSFASMLLTYIYSFI